jgi:hypothetical protein
MATIIRRANLIGIVRCLSMRHQTSHCLFSVFVLMLAVICCYGGVIGNRTVNQLLSASKRVGVGTVQSIENVNGKSLWRVAVQTDYFGDGEEVIDIRWIRELSESERTELSGSAGLFAVDHQGHFVGRTGSLSVRDVFAQAPARFSSSGDPSVRFCVDCLRALAIESNIIIRDLAVFSSYCASDRSLGAAVLEELQGEVNDQAVAALLKGSLQQPEGLNEMLEVSNRLNEKSSFALIENVGWVLLNFRESSPVALEGLARLASESRHPYVRHCAANALVVIHTEESWPHLSGLLYSEDKSIRLLAISGLQQIVDAGMDLESPRFEGAILRDGKPVQRQRRTRPQVDEGYRLRESDKVVENESALVGYWRSYASVNQ